ncbi:apolipoprotein N-acyltransferase [Myxococcota bacterium]|nr:apolipoprotein N-acyltransferase [Myxococcota bacterium]
MHRLVKWFPWFMAVLSGVMWFTSCPPFRFWPMAWVAMLPLLLAIRDATPRRAFHLGWVTGFVAAGGGFPWITDLIIRHGHLPAIAAWFIYSLYTLYQGLIFALIAWGIRRLAADWPKVPLWVAVPGVSVAVEFVFPLVFPWYMAITQGFVPTSIQIAEFTGPTGVTAMLVMFAALVFELVQAVRARRRPSAWLALPLAILVAVLGWSSWRIGQVRRSMETRPKMGVAMIQPNIGINSGKTRYFGEHQIVVHQRLSQEAERLALTGAIPRLDLLVWSESSYPYPMERTRTSDYEDPPQRMDFRRIKRGFTTPLLMGATTISREAEDADAYNSAQLIDREGKVLGRYDKNWLLVFGEYIPFYDYMPFLHDFFRSANMSNMKRGTQMFTLDLPAADTTAGPLPVRFGPLICYEDILPEFGRRAAKVGPNILVNVTNDAWFGATQEPWQHLALAVFRSVETRLPMVRNVNVGVSTFIMPTGELGTTAPAQEPPVNPDAGLHPVRFMESLEKAQVRPVEGTPGLFRLDVWPDGYVVYSLVPVMPASETFYVRFGDVFAWLCLLLTAFGVGFMPGRRRFFTLRERLFRKGSKNV